MNAPRKVDQDDVLRARTTLLGSGRLSYREQVGAYRVLAQVNPAAYLSKLAESLQMLGYESADRPDAQLLLFEEAAVAARAVGESEPKRTESLVGVLDSYQRTLYELGRRAEGFRIREEMARVVRAAFETGRVSSPVYGLRPLAAGLAEEGRHAESAAEYGRIVTAAHADTTGAGVPFWYVAWAAELDTANMPGAALQAFAGLLAQSRRALSEGRTSLSIVVWELVHYSRMLDEHQRPEQARATRKEADGLLSELATTGEPRNWSCILDWWTLLLRLSGRRDEPAVPGEPRPPLGENLLDWSRDIALAYRDGRRTLQLQENDLTRRATSDPLKYLPELITVHRRLTIRFASYPPAPIYRIGVELQHRFDEGVELARHFTELDQRNGPTTLARALTDRATMRLAAREHYPEALADFREACALTG